MVTEVSAMFVDTMHFLTPSGGKSNTCKNTIQSEEYIDEPSKYLHLKESPLLVIITVPWRQILTHYIFIQIWYWQKKQKVFFFFISHDHLNLIIVNLLNENQIKLYNWREPTVTDSKWYNAIMIQT